MRRRALTKASDSSSTVSPEVRRPESNKIKTLGGDSSRRCLKCSGKLWPEIARIIPLSSGIAAITSSKICGVNDGDATCLSVSRKSALINIFRSRKIAAKASVSSNPSSQPSAGSNKLTASGPPSTNSCASRLGLPRAWCSQNSARCPRSPRRQRCLDRPALIFERCGVRPAARVVRKLLATRHHHFDVERAGVHERAAPSHWSLAPTAARFSGPGPGHRRTAGLELQHLYRAMGWLGEALGNASPMRPRRGALKDLIEEELFARRRDLFTSLDLVSSTPPRCLHRKRWQHPRPVRQEQGPPQRLQADGIGDGD